MSKSTLTQADEKQLRLLAITLYDLGAYTKSLHLDELCDAAEVAE